MLKEASYKRLRIDFRVNNGHCRNYSSLIPPLGYGLDGPGIQTRSGRDFPHPSKPALGPTQPPVQLVPGFYPKVRRRGVALPTHPHLAPRLKKEHSYTSTPPLDLHGNVQGERLCFHLMLDYLQAAIIKYQATFRTRFKNFLFKFI